MCFAMCVCLGPQIHHFRNCTRGNLFGRDEKRKEGRTNVFQCAQPCRITRQDAKCKSIVTTLLSFAHDDDGDDDDDVGYHWKWTGIPSKKSAIAEPAMVSKSCMNSFSIQVANVLTLSDCPRKEMNCSYI